MTAQVRRNLFVQFIAVLLAVLPLLHISGAAADNGLNVGSVLSIATVDNRPLSIDRLLHKALGELGLKADITTAASLQQGYILANNGERNGVISSTPDMEQIYQNLIKVPVPLDNTNIHVFLRDKSALKINTWSDLSGLKVGILTQRVYIENSIPASAIVTSKENTKQLLDGLANGEYDAAVLSQRSHEMIVLPDGVHCADTVEKLPEYLYVHQSYAELVPDIAKAIEGVFFSGLGEKILQDIPLYETGRQKTVLHIVSSSTEITREEQFNAKLREPFKNDTSIEWYTIAFNSIRFSNDPSRLSYFASLLRRDCVSRNIAAIVVSGEDAFEFISEYYFLFFKNVPVIFYGVGEGYEGVIEEYAPFFTGIVEKPAVYETVSAAMELFPDTKNLYVINGHASEGKKYRKIFERQLSGFDNLNITYNEDISHDLLMKRVSALEPDTLVLVGSYFMDSNGQYYSQYEMSEFFKENCPAPVVSPYYTDLPYNAVGAKAMDYQKYGEVASDMLSRILAGEQLTNIPVVSGVDDLNRWVFNKDVLNQWGISEKALPKKSTVINKPPTVLEANPKFAFSMAAMIFMCIAVIAAMYEFLAKYRTQNVELIEAKEHLHTAEELIAKDEKLKEVKEWLESIIDNAPVSYMLAANHKVVEINENMKRNVGLDIGDNTRSIYNDLSDRERLIAHTLQGKAFKNEVVRIKTANGEVHRMLMNVSGVDYEGEKAFSVWAVDVEQEELEKDRIQTAWRNLRSIIDTMPVPACIVDVDSGQVVYGNNSYLKLMRLTSQNELSGIYSVDTLIDIQSDGMTASEVNNLLLHSSDLVSRDMQIRAGRDEVVDVRVSTCPIEYHDKKSVFAILTDLTAEKQRQRMLQNAAAKEKEANELKSHFLVNISHEIRTPMNAIIGLTEIELRKDLPYRANETYQKINISAQHLLYIINDILDMSKIEANKLEIRNEEFELEDVLNSALLVAAPRLDGKNVEFMLGASLDLPRYLVGDKTRLWQILKNLLDNSAKYTDEGTIYLTVYIDNDRSDEKTVSITFVVEDTGIGMSEEQLEKVFMPYEQFYSEAQKKYSGTGLGMPISKRFCELMGGVMRVDSTPGVGTEIRFSIPFTRSDKDETELQAVKTPLLKDLNILAVDDDELALNIMVDILKGAGANCVMAESGAKAMDIVYSYRNMGTDFDLILLDYMMDGMDGVETAKEIQSNLSNSPKLLMVTAYQRQLIMDDLGNNGISDVIEKPFVPTKFIRRLCAAMGFDSDLEEKKTVFTNFKNVKVLIFEDSRLNQEVASGMFAQFGITPLMVSDGKQGVELLEKNQDFDLIFMDLQMPVMDGHEATRIIRTDPRCDHIPIISLSASAMSDIVERCKEDGMDDHIAKPIEFAMLHKILLKWLPENKRVSEAGEFVKSKSRKSNPYNDALERFGGDKAFYERGKIEFAQSLPEQWPDFNQVVSDKDDTLREIHSIKGTAGTLGITDIYQCAIGFESSLRGNHPDEDMYRRLVDLCGDFKKENTQIPEDAGELPVENGTRVELTELLNRLEESLENYDPIGVSEVVQGLKQKGWPVSREVLDRICIPASEYNFKEALEALNRVKERIT